jgi:hypothetical protein
MSMSGDVVDGAEMVVVVVGSARVVVVEGA